MEFGERAGDTFFAISFDDIIIFKTPGPAAMQYQVTILWMPPKFLQCFYYFFCNMLALFDDDEIRITMRKNMDFIQLIGVHSRFIP